MWASTASRAWSLIIGRKNSQSSLALCAHSVATSKSRAFTNLEIWTCLIIGPLLTTIMNRAEISDRPLSLADWKCKKCSAQVKYQYRCAIKLRDESEELLVTIADEGAVSNCDSIAFYGNWLSSQDTFFKAIPPTDLTLSNVSVKTLEETMKSLLGMKVELCVMTYFPLDAFGSKTKKRAQVFGTELKSFLFNNED